MLSDIKKIVQQMLMKTTFTKKSIRRKKFKTQPSLCEMLYCLPLSPHSSLQGGFIHKARDIFELNTSEQLFIYSQAVGHRIKACLKKKHCL